MAGWVSFMSEELRKIVCNGCGKYLSWSSSIHRPLRHLRRYGQTLIVDIYAQREKCRTSGDSARSGPPELFDNFTHNKIANVEIINSPDVPINGVLQ
jgi:hypothetical protein